MIHCTASRPNQHLPFELLDKMHRAKGWNGCGYHYYITRDGLLHMGPKRWSAPMPATTMPTLSASAMKAGSTKKDVLKIPKPLAHRAALIALLRSLKTDYPDAEIMGHCELEGAHKDSPSLSCQEYRDYFKHLR